MSTIWKYSYYVYLIIALILFIEGLLQFNENTQRAVIILGIALLVTVKFFFTRNFRRRIEKRNHQE